MLVFTHTITPRLQYITDFIGKQITGLPLHLTDQSEEFNRYNGPKINYSSAPLSSNEIRIQPHSLLFEKGIKDQSVSCFEVNQDKAFFKTEGDFPFDIFAACFYLLSRYEEYLPHQKDEYGRYDHQNSIAFKENFLPQPLINKWINSFKKTLKEKFPSLPTIHSPLTTFIPTYDIDEAFSYKHKGSLRTIGGIIKAFLKGNWSLIAERRKVLKGKQADPFDSYGWLNELHEKYNLSPRYFFLLAQQTGKFDRNILPGEMELQQLIKEHAKKYTIGIHPSWQSGDDHSLMKKEIDLLENIAGRKITSSRQHFIRFTLPQTYRRLIEAGIQEDFSMGYGSINGFRASVASPFYWYDLEKEETTSFLLYPFCFMEANSFFEQKYSAAQALDEMRYYYKEVKAVNGTFVSIWHNSFLGTAPVYDGWRDVYERFVDEIR